MVDSNLLFYEFGKRTIVPILVFVLIVAGWSACAPGVRAESFEEIRSIRTEKYLDSVQKFAESLPPENRQRLINNAKRVVVEGLREFENLDNTNAGLTHIETPDCREMLEKIGPTDDDSALLNTQEFLKHQFVAPSRKDQLLVLAVPYDIVLNSNVLLADRSLPVSNPFSLIGNAHNFFSAYYGGSNQNFEKNVHKSIASPLFSGISRRSSNFATKINTDIDLSSFTLIAQTVVRRE